ncbi:hypothetical protein J3S04_31300 [Streptomyces griseocarneus]|uniref:DUF4177 domain-containing protein n=1 Tax=Streptomyces griseocarneus TaxID=51201 RepID=A0ABX7S038_9ACTN|nr:MULTISPECIES: hypothetical protein [Streptomyces]QSY52781.1 hypothetical protein J3S04_31300 [Streptomyces griseocarneus]
MRSMRSLALLASPIAAATALAFSPVLTPQAVAAPAHATVAAVPTVAWEYATAPLLPGTTKQILDFWGADGWELVQVVPNPANPGQLVAYFKRALPA